MVNSKYHYLSFEILIFEMDLKATTDICVKSINDGCVEFVLRFIGVVI